LFADNNCPYLK